MKKNLKEDILKIHTGNNFNIIVALTKGDKVYELKEFDRRDSFYDSMLSLYSRMGYTLEVFILHEEKKKEDASANATNESSLKNRVYCKELKQTWNSVLECSRDTGITERSILMSIYRGSKVFGKRFSFLPPGRRTQL